MPNVPADRTAVPLLDVLRERIARHGPLPVDQYMRACLEHPQHGYWQRAATIGAGGDFITAPEISQVFGELIGLWAVTVWDGMGRPSPLRLVELGPGRGTLMRDALRAAQAVPQFARRSDGASDRGQRSAASSCKRRHWRRRRDARDLAWRAGSGSARAGHRHRQRVPRCAAHTAAGLPRRCLARARCRSGAGRQLAVRGRTTRGIPERCGRRSVAPSSNCAPARTRCFSPSPREQNLTSPSSSTTARPSRRPATRCRPYAATPTPIRSSSLGRPT